MKPFVYGSMAVAFLIYGCARTAPGPGHSRDAGMELQAAAAPLVTHEHLAATGGELIEGTILEVIQVPQYTYLRLAVEDGRARWVAISTQEFAKGSKVSILAQTTLTNFESPSLHRTFDEISFGSIYEPSHPTAAGESCPGGNSSPELSDRHGAQGHGTAANDTPDIVAQPVPRAVGKNAHTVEETLSMRHSLSGKPVRLHAVVVKATYDVLGMTFIHLRDGTGDAKVSTNDLAATTTSRPNKGDTLLLEGTLVIDKDFGSGYRFDALLANAEVVSP